MHTVNPALGPKVPGGHAVQAVALGTLEYCPTGHSAPVAFNMPAPQYAPGAELHPPEQLASTKPAALP